MKIVAIGGGEIGRPGTKIETLKIDKEIITLSGKKNPKLLFIPTASNDAAGYVEVVERYFGKRLGCKVDSLLLVGKKISKNSIRQKIMSADIIYVGGGNTNRMLKLWKKAGVDKILKDAGNKGTVLSGLSAGAVCWFKEANSDSQKMISPTADYIRIRCMNFVPLFVCPHFDKEKDRQPSLKRMLKKTKGHAITIDNCAALEIIDNQYKIVTSKPRASAYVCYWEKGKYYTRSLKKVTTLRPLQELLSRP